MNHVRQVASLFGPLIIGLWNKQVGFNGPLHHSSSELVYIYPLMPYPKGSTGIRVHYQHSQAHWSLISGLIVLQTVAWKTSQYCWSQSQKNSELILQGHAPQKWLWSLPQIDASLGSWMEAFLARVSFWKLGPCQAHLACCALGRSNYFYEALFMSGLPEGHPK